MPRFFTGFEVPPDVAQQLAALCGGLPGARWVAPADYHLTLSFIGDVDDDLSENIVQELADVHSDPFDVTLDSFSNFGGTRPRALIFAASMERGLMHIHKAQERALRRAGAVLEKRKFIPHVTLARLHAVSPEALARFIAENPPPVIKFRIERLALFSARPKIGGGPYVVEAAYPFGHDQGSSTESQ